jgi:hypothetical protein
VGWLLTVEPGSTCQRSLSQIPGIFEPGAALVVIAAGLGDLTFQIRAAFRASLLGVLLQLRDAGVKLRLPVGIQQLQARGALSQPGLGLGQVRVA